MTLFKKAVVPFRLGRVLSLTSNFAAVAIALMVFAAPANAQQTGDIGGQVTDASGNGIAATVLYRLGHLLGEARYRRVAIDLGPGPARVERQRLAELYQQTR